jgi:hypothetical protein
MKRAKDMENKGFLIVVIGGTGLGLLIGSEFAGRYITIIGAILVIISLVAIGVLSYMKK